MALRPTTFIAHKRDGGIHSREDIHTWIRDFQSGAVTDYQMTAWLMAVYLNGLDDLEMLALTEAMLHSGRTLKKRQQGPPRVDKHSTGGVGDKISLALAPLAAATGLHVPMIAGRGLGHTGGTLDKLEAIPGYSTQLSAKAFENTVKQAGASIIGQTQDIAPVDRRVYALRDVTSTVACRPLIVASILSKKLAEGLDGLVLDVKVGRGAFMTDASTARRLAQSLVDVAHGLGTPAVARLTQMNVPLGTTIGNALEVKEAVAILRGQGPPDSTELTLLLVEEMLLIGGCTARRKDARTLAEKRLFSGEAFEGFKKMVQLHGGDPRAIDDLSRLPHTKKRFLVKATRSGKVAEIDALELAQIALELGAGRTRADQKVDPAVGLELHVKPGDSVAVGDALATLHAHRKQAPLEERLRIAFRLQRRTVEKLPLVLGRPIRSRS